jgi:hypothetical protein
VGFIFATPVALELQAPPVFPLVAKFTVPVEQTACVPLKTPAFGVAVTVTVLVEETAAHPPAAGIVYVIVAVPAATPVTTPVVAFTVAIPAALVVQAPPVFPSVVNVVVPATQIACVPDKVPLDGAAVIVTVADTGFDAQPAAFVPTTE